MIEKNNTQKALGLFFRHPTRTFHLREMSRELGISMPAVLSAVGKLKKEGLLLVEKTTALTVVKASTENPLFSRLKRAHNLEAIYVSGLVDFLQKKCRTPAAIICFGSYSRGDDIEKSDIDIAVISGAETDADLGKFEKLLGREISMHFVNLKKISAEFRLNLCNGIVLEGAL